MNTSVKRHTLSGERVLHFCAAGLLGLGSSLSLYASAQKCPQAAAVQVQQPGALLVVGFMGGRIKADNMVHQEAQIAQSLQRRNASSIRVLTFANHDGSHALQAVVKFVDTDGDGVLDESERSGARVVIYGHSWGASETVNLARTLDRIGVPVLLTIQVDSVQKTGENDRMIPANVQQAMNFYQDEGLLSGRSRILANDPHRTLILGNQRLSYKHAPVNCDGFPWFARPFMKPHIEIENDPRVWNRVEAMIQERVGLTDLHRR